MKLLPQQETMRLRDEAARLRLKDDPLIRPVKTRNRGGRPPEPIRHGTAAGYKAHRRRNEPACHACREANNAYSRTYGRGR